MRTLLVSLLVAGFGFAQTEDGCDELGGYWKEAPGECFLREDMGYDQLFLLSYIRDREAEKAQLQHEQQEFNASGKTTRRDNFDALIASLTSKMNATSDADVKDTYQAEIDRVTTRRDELDAFDVSEHGAIISALSTDIGKHKEELDRLLP